MPPPLLPADLLVMVVTAAATLLALMALTEATVLALGCDVTDATAAAAVFPRRS